METKKWQLDIKVWLSTLNTIEEFGVTVLMCNVYKPIDEIFHVFTAEHVSSLLT